MAIDFCSENASSYSNTMAMSPRISFSHDLSQSDTVPVEQILRSFSSSSVDFNFCVQDGSENSQASMADELFSDGKILPTQIKTKKETHPPLPPQSAPPDKQKLPSLPPPLLEEEVETKQQNSKSFWGFKRSSSCGSGYARSLCPIPLLSRSNSTGSSTSSKRSSSSKEGFNQKHHQHHSQKSSLSQKPPLRKSSYSYGNNTSSTSNGVRVNPVLNLGFGSFFSSSSVKDKNKKK